MKNKAKKLQVTEKIRNFAIDKNKMAQKENKEKEKTKREVLSKYYLDMSKTAFGTTVLTNVPALFELTDFTYKTVLIFFVGTISAISFAYIGHKILN